MAEKRNILDRKGFNFYRSYYDVAKELSDKDRLLFYDALIAYQFTKEEIDLCGIAKIAFISQKHNLNAQVEGYENVGLRLTNKGTFTNPSKGASVGGTDGASITPSVQEQVQVQVQVIEQGKDEVKESKKKPKKVFIAPSLLDVIEYFNEKGFSEQAAKKAFDYYDVADWHDSKGNKVNNWKQKMQSVWFKDENKSKTVIKPQQPTFDHSSYDIPTYFLQRATNKEIEEKCLDGTFKLKT